MILAKMPIAEIAKAQDLAFGTIINHIEKLIEAGEKLDLEYLKPVAVRFDAIADAFEQCGDERLRPVFDYLEEKFWYDELKLVRVILRNFKL